MGPSKIELTLAEDCDIDRLVEAFESLQLPIANWTHRAHLAVGIYYLRKYGYDSALARIRERINAYNRACGTPDGYNETVTVLFLRKISSEVAGDSNDATMSHELARLEGFCRVDWIYQYYSREVIWSSMAKKAWIDPDIREIDF